MIAQPAHAVPPKAFALAEAMHAEFGSDAFAVARARLKMRVRDGIPAMVTLYAGVCTLLADGGKAARRALRDRAGVAIRREFVPVRIEILHPSHT